MKLYVKGRMSLQELERFRECNELDVVYKMQELMKSAQGNAEKVVKNNKAARVELRKNMNDIRIMCMIMRDMVKMRRVPAEKNRALELAIEQEKRSIEQEKMKEHLAPDHVVEEQIMKIKSNEKIRRENREQKAKDREGTRSGQHQEAEDQL